MFYGHIRNEKHLVGKETISDPLTEARERRIELDYFKQVRGLTDAEIAEHKRLSAYIFDATIKKVN